MRITAGSRVVVTQGFLFRYAGSEVATFELVREFASFGAEVLVVTHGWSEEWAAEFAPLDKVRLVRLDDEGLDDLLGSAPIDLAWIHHQVIPRRMLEAPGETAFVFHHMSPYHALEFPIAFEIERKLATAAVFAAPETKSVQTATGLFEGIEPERLRVLGNPAPGIFDTAAPRRSPRVERVLIVSNHIPNEVLAAVATLTGVEVVVRGEETGKGAVGRLVDPAEIQGVDAVITIGKTVQYSLIAGTPVYCYDHFGGPGWLSPANVEQARAFNFSGRSFEKKDAATITAELVDGFAAAKRDADEIKATIGDQFRLDLVLTALLDEVPPKPAEQPTKAEIESHSREQDFRDIYYNVTEGQRRTVDYLTGRLEIAETQRDDARNQLRDIRSSRSYKAAMRASSTLSRLKPRRG
jgi:hypothetical protein